MEEDPSLTTPDVGPREPLWQPAGGAAAATAWEVQASEDTKRQTVPSRSLSRHVVEFSQSSGQAMKNDNDLHGPPHGPTSQSSRPASHGRDSTLIQVTVI